ncbi:hypothetical protein Cgig2_024443 [Carnegiea gigantea]|uniref:RING-CH-type domain-containing protein n=1 Tax=Carnegiea gigantea TaxID=171969 RepID=A0A9Q1KL43_9CARY|nr:hypothetical protein Cgig2_024443 [Carnegiea gigantea]
MVNDYMVCVDRILASACLRSGSVGNELERKNSGVVERESGVESVSSVCVSSSSNGVGEIGEGCSKKEVKECRICQEEDDEQSLEAPCACNGTLKVFTPNYSLPPPRPTQDVMAVDISQMWGHHFGFRDPHFLALAAAERRLLESEYDEYAVANAGNITFDVCLVDPPSADDYKRFWSDAGVFNILSFSSFLPSTCWVSSSLLCPGPLMVHFTHQEEETGLSHQC